MGVSAGVVDAGYEGAMGALMEVKSPKGVVFYKNAQLSQIVYEKWGKLSGDTRASISFLSTSSVGCDGTESVRLISIPSSVASLGCPIEIFTRIAPEQEMSSAVSVNSNSQSTVGR